MYVAKQLCLKLSSAWSSPSKVSIASFASTMQKQFEEDFNTELSQGYTLPELLKGLKVRIVQQVASCKKPNDQMQPFFDELQKIGVDIALSRNPFIPWKADDGTGCARIRESELMLCYKAKFWKEKAQWSPNLTGISISHLRAIAECMDDPDGKNRDTEVIIILDYYSVPFNDETLTNFARLVHIMLRGGFAKGVELALLASDVDSNDVMWHKYEQMASLDPHAWWDEGFQIKELRCKTPKPPFDCGNRAAAYAVRHRFADYILQEKIGHTWDKHLLYLYGKFVEKCLDEVLGERPVATISIPSVFLGRQQAIAQKRGRGFTQVKEEEYEDGEETEL